MNSDKVLICLTRWLFLIELHPDVEQADGPPLYLQHPQPGSLGGDLQLVSQLLLTTATS